MNNYYIVATFKDHACGEAFYQDSRIVTDISTALSIAIGDTKLFDHVCIIPYEYLNEFRKHDKYTEIFPYAIEIAVGDKLNINKLLTLLKIT